MSDSKKWSMPLRNWKLAMNGFVIEFADDEHVGGFDFAVSSYEGHG